MRLLNSSNCRMFCKQGSVTTIGNFDGVHIGHQALLFALKQEAETLKLPLVVILFEPQPSEYFKGLEAEPRLQNLREKIALLANHGVDYVYCIKFNETLAKMTAVDFANIYLFHQLETKYLMVGEDFRFGYLREGDVTLLKKICDSKHCHLSIFKDFPLDNKRISSTQIRTLIRNSELEKARSLLGRDYALCGRVIKGQGLGAQWGIPTANLTLNRPPLPLKGVFCVNVLLPNGDNVQGVANLGLRPSLNGDTIVLEVHLFNFNALIYGQRLQVFFLHKLRDEQKFPSIAALIQQIHLDIAASKKWFQLRDV